MSRPTSARTLILHGAAVALSALAGVAIGAQVGSHQGQVGQFLGMGVGALSCAAFCHSALRAMSATPFDSERVDNMAGAALGAAAMALVFGALASPFGDAFFALATLVGAGMGAGMGRQASESIWQPMSSYILYTSQMQESLPVMVASAGAERVVQAGKLDMGVLARARAAKPSAATGARVPAEPTMM